MLRSEIFDSDTGMIIYKERTICEVLRQVYDNLYIGLCATNPKLLEAVTPLLEEAYVDGIKMTKKLVEYKVSMPDWERNMSLDEVARIRGLRQSLTKKLAYADRLKLAIVFDPDDYKFSEQSYSKTYNDMRLALIRRFGQVRRVSKDCSYKDIEADVIIFFDPHSTHNIMIEDIHKHSALKYEYMNDPHQTTQVGVYPNGQRFHKLGNIERCKRAMARGVNYIITPSVWGHDKYLKPYLNNDTGYIFFPPVPRNTKLIPTPLSERENGVMLSGHLWQGRNGFQPYKFRLWAANHPKVRYIPHYVNDKNVPIREQFITLIARYKGAVAACEYYPVAKYFEIPLAGSVLFAQKCEDFEKLGFVHGKSCVLVDKRSFSKTMDLFLSGPEKFQYIADAGRKHVEANWTAEKFADRIYNHCAEVINGGK